MAARSSFSLLTLETAQLSQFLYLPHQAVPCCLAGLSPKGRLWSEEAVDHLMELTQAGSGQVLWARLMDWKMEDSLGLLPCVELFIGNCSVNTSLVQIGHAIFQWIKFTCFPFMNRVSQNNGTIKMLLKPRCTGSIKSRWHSLYLEIVFQTLPIYVHRYLAPQNLILVIFLLVTILGHPLCCKIFG